MDRILFRDVRCFRGEHDIPFAPLTFLVGENSTGKSTILAMTRVAWDVGHSREEPDFNEEPFQLGAFNELRHVDAQPEESVQFRAGFRSEIGVEVVGTFSSIGGQPSLSFLRLTGPVWTIDASVESGTFVVEFESQSGEKEGLFSSLALLTTEHLLRLLKFLVEDRQAEPPKDAEEHSHISALRDAKIRVHHLTLGSDRPLALAPVRTRPKRTYDPLREIRSPEGDHVPMLLARLRATDPAAWEALAADLAEYGRGAGLFSDLLVRRFDGNEASPFQLQVRLAGQNREVNLIDVGYGVSQVLPILVDAFTQPEESSFLLQQPEVHLHPKAQAELGSMLVSLVKRRRHKFMIETHSDHLVDRVRLEVKRGKIPAEDVRIVYCERADSHVLTHEIKIDANGNLVGAPEGYRQFFLDEELALLGG